ncbi:ADP-glyceromanno-heptose 6-epimerase [Aquella oligotrophica]|uniref:ADP-L-glycero-D-manno-heptose-6-epimerase n=1 Tax=Aquella oligotrophica TaxID=2067065 RepID=A0A2I7N9D7_9NEIS|nr:ADP-glyceromanno-heptose 6-epimerase [Aquella oligotrophica]AUR53041.1 ADP-glyceromanno-heptose 6-epimerase [Aquella oligotrophica]
MIIVVTGAAGFIGANIVKELNARGHFDIIAVDNLTNGNKARNLADLDILDYIDKEDFIQSIVAGEYDNQVDYIFHQGACSATVEADGRYIMKNNYEYSCLLLEYAQKNEVPMIYASSAATYGASSKFVEDRENEIPLNVYGYSKLLFDQTVRRYFEGGLKAPVVGLKYFNVYGHREFHKGRMASVVLHNFRQYQEFGGVKLFEGCQGYGNGEQSRDFISIEDVVNVNMHFFTNHIQNPHEVSGIFNCGTGQARSFNDLAMATINACRKAEGKPAIDLATAVTQGILEYIPFPGDLAGKYQCFTQADNTRLINDGLYKTPFLTLEQGVENYVNQLLA